MKRNEVGVEHLQPAGGPRPPGARRGFSEEAVTSTARCLYQRFYFSAFIIELLHFFFLESETSKKMSTEWSKTIYVINR